MPNFVTAQYDLNGVQESPLKAEQSGFAAMSGNAVRAPVLAAFGDSITRLGIGGSTGTRNAYESSRSFQGWFQILTNYAHYSPVGIDPNTDNPIGYNFGISGDTVVNMASRFSAVVNSSPRPTLCFLLAGTNDIRGGAGLTPDSRIQSAFLNIFQQAAEAGIFLAVFSILPRNAVDGAAGNDFSVAERAQMNRLNSWLASVCQNTPNTARFIDVRPYCTLQTDATGSMVTNGTVDGVHPSPRLDYYMARAAIAALPEFVRVSPNSFVTSSDLYDVATNPYGNMLLNPNFIGTGGTASAPVTGSVPTSWTCERATGSLITATVAPVNKTVGIATLVGSRITLSSPGGGTATPAEAIRFRPTATPNIPAGRTRNNAWYEGGLDIDVAAPSAAGLVRAVYLTCQDDSTGGATVRALDDRNTSVIYPFPDEAWSGKLRTPPLLTVGTGNMRWQLFLSLNPAIVGTCVMDIYLPFFRELRNIPFAYP